MTDEKMDEIEKITKTQIEYIKMLENENTELHDKLNKLYVKCVKSGLLTIDEVRYERGLDPLL